MYAYVYTCMYAFMYVYVCGLMPELLNDWELHYLGDGTELACAWLVGEMYNLDSAVALYAKLEPMLLCIVEAVLGAG